MLFVAITPVTLGHPEEPHFHFPSPLSAAAHAERQFTYSVCSMRCATAQACGRYSRNQNLKEKRWRFLPSAQIGSSSGGKPPLRLSLVLTPMPSVPSLTRTLKPLRRGRRCLTLGPFGNVVGLEPLRLLRSGLAAERRVAVGEPAVFVHRLIAVHIDCHKNESAHRSRNNEKHAWHEKSKERGK